jgi:hypothetical protein
MAGINSKFRSNLSAPALLRGCVAIALAVFAFAGLAAAHAQTRTITTTTTTHTYSRSSSFQFDIEEGSSGSSCSPGYGECDGKCVPVGSACCRGGTYCPHGNTCTADHHCLPPNSPRVCGGGRYCDAGFRCSSDNSCISEQAELRKEVERIQNEFIADWNERERKLTAKMDQEQREKDATEKREAEKFGDASNKMMREFEERQKTGTAPSSAVTPSPTGQSHISLPGLPGAAPAKRVASRDETSPMPPPPTVVVQGMQVNPPSPGNGSRFNVPTPCQDLTGASGCVNSGASPAVQAQINQAQASLRQANRIREIDPSYDGKRQAIENLYKAAADFQAAGDLVQAAEAAEQAQPLVDDLHGDHASNAGPPFAPAEFWLGTPYAQYCATANSVERGSAYYGAVCYADNTRSAPTQQERRVLCAQRLETFKPHSPGDAWLAEQMAKAPLDCNVDGSPMTLRQALKWKLAHPNT